ncbi:pumilio homolog 2-like protein [Tanacetum coccineum]
MYRSGSAPPTVEGSLSAVGGLFNNNSSNNNHGHNNGLAFSEFASGNGFMSEEELRACQVAERWSSGLGGIGDRRKANRTDGGGGGGGGTASGGGGGGLSMFSMPPGFNSKKQENENLEAEKVKDDLRRSTPPSGHPSRPASRTAFEINDETLGPNDVELAQPQHGAKGPPMSYSYAAALGGRANASERRNPNSPGLFNGVSSYPKDAADLVTALSAMNLSNGVMESKNNKNNLYYDGSLANLQSHYQHIDGGGNHYMNNGTSGYSIHSPQMMSGQHGNVNLLPLFETDAAASAMAYPGMES